MSTCRPRYKCPPQTYLFRYSFLSPLLRCIAFNEGVQRVNAVTQDSSESGNGWSLALFAPPNNGRVADGQIFCRCCFGEQARLFLILSRHVDAPEMEMRRASTPADRGCWKVVPAISSFSPASAVCRKAPAASISSS